MSNFKNAVKIHELIEENAELKMQVRTFENLQKVDQNRILVNKNKIEKLELQLRVSTNINEQLGSEILKLEGENEALQEELDILKSYFKLKL